MKRKFLLPFGIAILVACSEKKEVVVNSIEAPGQENVVPDPLTEEEKLMQNTTSVVFTEEEHDFGKTIKDKQYYCEFEYKNTGNFPLLISNVKASCGCTTPEKPDAPLAPGETAKLKVGFKPGTDTEIDKTVTVTANTDPQITILHVKANQK